MRLFSIVFLVLIAFFHQPVLASSDADALGTCFGDNTNGKERKELARWVFMAMSAHPELQSISAVTDADRLASNKEMGALVTRLVSEQCVPQFKAVMKNDGNQGIVLAFKVLGELAMKELMTNQNVTKSIGEYARYLDQKKIASALGPK